MPKQVYIAVGNHTSLAGIHEIVYSLYSCLSEEFSVSLTRSVRKDSVNIIIDEFSRFSDSVAVKKMKELYPNTKIVIIATEFITPITLFGVELIKTFNFFGSLRDWRMLLTDALGTLFGGTPSYTRMRYLGFLRALEHCDLLVAIHPPILPTIAEALAKFGPQLTTPLLVYPEIGPLSATVQNRLRNLPVGFTMTGTRTRYRRRITRKLIRTFRRIGWFLPVYKYIPFKKGFTRDFVSKYLPFMKVTATNASPAGNISRLYVHDDPISPDYLSAQYNAISPQFLFNINPPQSANWPYSSPMRILRAILIGQMPVITKRFHDHALEDVAAMWDGGTETAVELGTHQFLDRGAWLAKYQRSLAAYDRQAREANKPFVRAIMALADSLTETTTDVAPARYPVLHHAGQHR